MKEYQAQLKQTRTAASGRRVQSQIDALLSSNENLLQLFATLASILWEMMWWHMSQEYPITLHHQAYNVAAQAAKAQKEIHWGVMSKFLQLVPRFCCFQKSSSLHFRGDGRITFLLRFCGLLQHFYPG